ncbi:uncharacterized protein LOC130495928 [Raphanus sativus]|uniref:Uncharacterized protein LOC130495928 n=1 Tax=Raphanus sativus TaxID=3726 RepID=A0A9W3BW76_RAPSA|nr:uncharacterized protein LOC130495928 [Raphanus sativus]
MWPIEPQARTSTMLNPTGSFDFKRLTYSLARSSPASKWVFPFCSGTCFATFSLWKLKKTNRPRKRERPVLRLITTDGLSSALTTAEEDLLPEVVVESLGKAEEEEPARRRERRPWNEMELGFFWEIVVEKVVVGVSKADALVAMFSSSSSSSFGEFFLFSFSARENEWF